MHCGLVAINAGCRVDRLTSPRRAGSCLGPLFRGEDGQKLLGCEHGLVQTQQLPEPGDRWWLHVGTGQSLFSTEDRPGVIVQQHLSLMERYYSVSVPAGKLHVVGHYDHEL